MKQILELTNNIQDITPNPTERQITTPTLPIHYRLPSHMPSTSPMPPHPPLPAN